MCEILAPVGSKKNLITAVSAGANAVYLGLKDFSARKVAENFTIEDLKYACAYCKTFNVKVYVAVNTLVKESEINEFIETVNKAYSLGVDAFILQDILLGKYLKEKNPNIQIVAVEPAEIDLIQIHDAHIMAPLEFVVYRNTFHNLSNQIHRLIHKLFIHNNSFLYTLISESTKTALSDICNFLRNSKFYNLCTYIRVIKSI